MSERIFEIVILAEDARSIELVRRFLQELGRHRRSIRDVRLPGGSGEQFVRTRYPDELRACRNNAARRRSALVVMLDADIGSVGQHHAELSRALNAAEVSPPQPDESVFVLIPKRSIETWIRCLLGDHVDEERRYTADDREVRETIEVLFQWTRPNARVPDHCVESLRQALPELARVPHR